MPQSIGRLDQDRHRFPRGAGKCLGIVGYSHIGTQVGLLAEALGMRVVFYDIETKLALGNVQALPSLDALLDLADVVTLHVPETPGTFG